MVFSDLLNQYMQELGCTAKYLSQETGVSMAQISRYRTGTAEPLEKERVERIAETLGRLAQEKKLVTITEETIRRNLLSSLDEEFDYEAFRRNLNRLIETLGINLTKLAAYCNYNVSSISKVRLGRRNPRDPAAMARSIANYAASNYRSKTDCRKVFELIGKNENAPESTEAYVQEIYVWLIGKSEDAEAVHHLAEQVDEFDLDEYLKAKKIGRVIIPTVPIQLPVEKTFAGVQGMEDGIVAFLKATVHSRSSRDVIIYSDHPVEHCMSNLSFVKQWMRGIAAMALKGIRINIIHNVNRPFHEMMLGLEGWIPLYMTGMVFPYYLQDNESNYHHLIMASGNAAISGDAIKHHPDSGRYYFEKANAEVAEKRIRAEQLLSCAKPLFDIFRKEREKEFLRVMDELLQKNGMVKSIFTAPPIYTISDHLLTQVLSHNNVSAAEAALIHEYVKMYRNKVECFVENGVMDQSVSVFSKADFSRYPVSLSLSGMFCEKNIRYTYDEYVEHINEAKAFASQYSSYRLHERKRSDYRNLQINIRSGEFVVLSKNKTPAIHFVSRHPKLIEASQNMIMVLRDEE